MSSTNKEPVPFRGTAAPHAVVKVYTRGDDILRATVWADHQGFFSGLIAGLADGIYRFYAMATAPGRTHSRPSDTTECTLDRLVPTVTSFAVPATSYDLTFPVLTFTAVDSVGVTGYLITENPTPPSLLDPGWSPTPPAQHTVPSRADYMLYPWARDAVGNISLPYAGQPVSIVPPPPPVVTSFTVPARTTLFAIPVLTFTGAAMFGVTGYLITESAIPPLVNDPGWSPTPQTSYTVSAEGNYVLYAWVLDGFGQVSTAYPANVAVAPVAPVILAPPSGSTVITPVTLYVTVGAGYLNVFNNGVLVQGPTQQFGGINMPLVPIALPVGPCSLTATVTGFSSGVESDPSNAVALTVRALPATPYRTYIQSLGSVKHQWSLDELVGEYQDSGSRNQPLQVLVGGSQGGEQAPCVLSGASYTIGGGRLDEGAGYVYNPVDAPTMGPGAPLSIVFWAKGFNQDQGIGKSIIATTQRFVMDNGWQVSHGGGELQVRSIGGIAGPDMMTSFPCMELFDVNWHVFVITHDGSGSFNGTKFYVDGVEVALDAFNSSGTMSGIPAQTNPTRVTSWISDLGISWSGNIDEVSVAQVAYSPAQVAAIAAYLA